jgi:hypothetical protein
LNDKKLSEEDIGLDLFMQNVVIKMSLVKAPYCVIKLASHQNTVSRA